MIDSHCHLDHEPLFENIIEVLKRSKENGVKKILTICTTINGFSNIKDILKVDDIIYGPFGRVSTRFVAKMQASWDGNEGQISETFNYDSGNSQKRMWTLKLGKDGVITADAEDLVGTGTGHQAGSAVVLKYTIKLTKEAGGHALKVTDWMYLMENGVVMNRSQFRKFGIKVAEVVATMRPELPDQIAAE